MRPQRILIALFFAATLICIDSCTKDSKSPPTITPPVVIDPEVAAFLDDQLFINAQLNDLTWLATLSMESCPIITGADSAAFSQCGVTSNVVNLADWSTARLTFDGNECNGVRRSGQLVITVSRSSFWKDRGTEVLLSFDNLEITRVSDRKKITFNRDVWYTNSTGGLIQERRAGDSLLFQFEPIDLTVSFEDGPERQLLGTKRIKRTTDSRGNVITVTGLSVVNTKDRILQHGTSRTGQAFWLSAETPLIFAEGCNYRGSDGSILFQTNSIDGSVRLGVNEQGASQACAGTTNPYYYQVEWQRTGDTARSRVVVPY
jgi:hypothetical protein